MLRSAALITVLVTVTLVSATAQTQPAAEAPKPDAPKAEPPKVRPFDELIKDAEKISGVFNIYRTEDRVLLEIAPEQFGKTFMFSLTCESGLGERGFYASQMCGQRPVEFQKSGRRVQMIARPPIFTAQEGTPIRRAVERSFAKSILGSSRVESAPHPQRKSLLVDLGAMLLTDVPMMTYALEATYRIPYRFDTTNSSFGRIKCYDTTLEIEAHANYTVDKPPVPPLVAPGAPTPPSVPRPRTLADLRSMQFAFRYSLSELPHSAGYTPRYADDRVGHFFTQLEDYTTDAEVKPTRRLIQRWHLEKSDPSAALARPKKPIVFWIENTVPLKYRDSVREGVLMWNKAFERIGFQDAIEVKQQPDDAEWDAADVRYSTIRWFINTDTGFAIGPSRVNPYTGEIYDADIGFSENYTRFERTGIRDTLHSGENRSSPFLAPWSTFGAEDFCSYADGAAHEAAFAMDVLEARGIDPNSPEADAIVQAMLREVTAHEVGHTLGLRHNFAASTIRTLEQYGDATLTAREGLSGSVMDYNPPNVAPKDRKQGEYYNSSLGPYDYWAIEYAYKPIAAATPDDELPELAKIASRATEPQLAYATDEDAGVSPLPFDMDPSANRFDIGPDTLAYADYRLKLSEEVLSTIDIRVRKAGDGYQPLLRTFQRANGLAASALYIASKNIGGVYQYRDHFGDPNARTPLQPVPAEKQRQAFQLIRTKLFSPTAFQFSPDLLNKLVLERHSDRFVPNAPAGPVRFDVPIHTVVLSLQQRVLERLMHPVVLSRVLDSSVKPMPKTEPFRLSDLFRGLYDSIWAEFRKPAPSLNVNSFRRSLQREHLKRLMNLLLRDGGAPEDARTLARYQLTELEKQLKATAPTRSTMPLETRAHIEETLARIQDSLRASIQRTAF